MSRIQKINEERYQFSDGDIKNIYLMLWEDVYSYECIYTWEKFSENSLPTKK